MPCAHIGMALALPAARLARARVRSDESRNKDRIVDLHGWRRANARCSSPAPDEPVRGRAMTVKTWDRRAGVGLVALPEKWYRTHAFQGARNYQLHGSWAP